jgi:16S rRNA (guanine1207-N2)-methyltransferase
MDIQPMDRVLDLGCGSGILGMVAARIAVKGHVWLVDANSEAVTLTQRNLQRNNIINATVLGSDSTSAIADMQFDVVVSNPPFHKGRNEARDLGPRFIVDAAQVLQPNGRCYIVANRFLPYEAVMHAQFANVHEIAGNTRFKVLCGSRKNAAQAAATPMETNAC